MKYYRIAKAIKFGYRKAVAGNAVKVIVAPSFFTNSSVISIIHHIIKPAVVAGCSIYIQTPAIRVPGIHEWETLPAIYRFVYRLAIPPVIIRRVNNI